LSEYTLYLGDCLEYMKSMPDKSVDAVITDPPYGINHSSHRDSSWMDTEIDGDNDTNLRDAVIDTFQNKSMALFGSWKSPRPEGIRGILIWDKGPAFGMGDLTFPWKMSWEEIYIFGDEWVGYRDEGVLRNHIICSWESHGRTHPHEKPVSLIKHLLSKLPSDFTIFDPFMGSGTTGVACMQLGRKFIGCEIDPGYFAIAEKRIAQAQMQLLLPLDIERSSPMK